MFEKKYDTPRAVADAILFGMRDRFFDYYFERPLDEEMKEYSTQINWHTTRIREYKSGQQLILGFLRQDLEGNPEKRVDLVENRLRNCVALYFNGLGDDLVLEVETLTEENEPILTATGPAPKCDKTRGLSVDDVCDKVMAALAS